MARLIVNADDFGLTRGVNRAIAESCQHGIVTSTTLIANGGAFSDAVAIAPTLERISVGCHVVLVDGVSVLPAAQVLSLTELRTGRFPDQLGRVVVRAFRGQLDPKQIESEVTAQIRKLQDAGVAVSHVDTHKHTHLFPQILRPILRAAKSCGVKAIRNPFGRLNIRLALTRPVLWKRTATSRPAESIGSKLSQNGGCGWNDDNRRQPRRGRHGSARRGFIPLDHREPA